MSGKKQPSPGSYEFLLPEGLDLDALVGRLQDGLALTRDTERHCRHTWHDRFDGRLYHQGLLLEYRRCGTQRELIRRRLDGRGSPAQLPCRRSPRRLDDIPSPLWQQQLRPLLENRALLPLIELQSRRIPLRQADGEGKTRLRIDLVEYRLGKRRGGPWQRRLRILPVRGYGKSLTTALVLLADLRLPRATTPVAVDAMQAAGVDPVAYSSKYQLSLEADARSDIAFRRILGYLREQARRNEDGIRRDLDSEFLHDFRVALRRSRSLLGHAAAVLPPRRLQALQRDIAWLAAGTGACRDYDVYLEDFPVYCRCLPDHLKAGLKPLHDLLLDKRRRAHRQLVRSLQSRRYQQLQRRWAALATAPLADKPSVKQATTPIRVFAAGRLRKQLKRILKHGRQIRMCSPPQALHDLRKECKKARYLLEFFQDLLPEAGLEDLLPAFKELQNVLGRYQDLCVQQRALQDFYHELHGRGGCAADTYQALTALITHMRDESAQARLSFARAFRDFDSEEHLQILERLAAARPASRKAS